MSPDLPPSEFLADVEEAVTDPPDADLDRDERRGAWGDAVAAFLADLLDVPGAPSRSDATETLEFALDAHSPSAPVEEEGSPRRAILGIPAELADLPGAAERALTRVTRSAGETEMVYPSVAKALHDVVIAEVLADRLADRIGSNAADIDAIASLVATTIDYFFDLAATRYEGFAVTHGAVIAADSRGINPIHPAVAYPGRLPSRKRTPLLFDGNESVLVIAASGSVLGGFGRDSLPENREADTRVQLFGDLDALGGSLTATASAAFHGIGFYLRSDRSLWVFEDGTPLFIRRTGRWRSVAIHTFVERLGRWGRTDDLVARRTARAAIRLSVQSSGAVLAIAKDSAALRHHLEQQEDFGTGRTAVDDDLSRLIPQEEPLSSGLLARLARIDGATIVDRTGRLLAYGAIVHSTTNGGQGARSGAAKSLSMCADVAISVSQDGPITVFVDGNVALELL